jgi:hypothetical protein
LLLLLLLLLLLALLVAPASPPTRARYSTHTHNMSAIDNSSNSREISNATRCRALCVLKSTSGCTVNIKN